MNVKIASFDDLTSVYRSGKVRTNCGSAFVKVSDFVEPPAFSSAKEREVQFPTAKTASNKAIVKRDCNRHISFLLLEIADI